MSIPTVEAAVVTEVVVGGKVDAGKVVEDWPDTCVVDPAIVALGVAVAVAVPDAVVLVEGVLDTGCWVDEAVNRISKSL